MPPPDVFTFDWDAPYPDVITEAVRQRVNAALADLADHLEQLADSFLLGQTAADFAQTVLTNFTAMQQTVTDHAGQVAALTDRVAALEVDVADLQSRVSALESPAPGGTTTA